MTTPAIRRHPIHPLLIVFPITFFMAAPALDVVHVATGSALWARLAFWDIVLGIVALAAAVPGFIDDLSLRGRAGRLATYHLVLNLTVVGLFVANLFLRGGAGSAIWIPLALSVAGAAILGVAGWIGGHLVYVHRVGVSEDARGDLAARRRAA